MSERKESKKLEKIFSDSSTGEHELLELKNTAERITTAAMQYALSENAVTSRRIELMRRIKMHEKPVTFSQDLRFNQRTILKPKRRFAMAWVFIAITALSLGGIGTVSASNDALPGDLLYPVKIASEDIQLLFNDDKHDALLLLDFMDERLQEIETLTEDENIEGIDLALESYQNHMEQITNLMTKLQPDDPVAGNALQTEIQNRLEEQAQRMLNINEDMGEQLQIREQIQDRIETQEQLNSGTDELSTGKIENGNGNQNDTNTEQDNGQQGEQQNQQQSQTQFSVSLQAYELTEDDQFVLHFAVNGAQSGEILVRVNGIEYACTNAQSTLICKGPALAEETVWIEVIDPINGSILFDQWISVPSENVSSTSNGGTNGQGGSGGKQH